MKLLGKDVPERAQIKLDKFIKADNTRGVMTFGDKNDYPQVIERIVNSSVTAKAIADINARFLTGAGFENAALNDIVVGRDKRFKQVTLLDMLRQVAASVAISNGAYVHANLNREGKIGNTKLVPFKHCRFSKPDDGGYSSKIVVHENWEQKDFRFDKKNQKLGFDVFNLDKTFLTKRIGDDVDSYRGQIYFQFWDNTYFYPLSPFDPVYLDADTEWQLSIFKNREIRNGFVTNTIVRMAETDQSSELANKVRGMAGADGDRIIVITDEVNPETGEIENPSFKIEPLESKINDKLFENWERSITNKIRKANKALPAILIEYENSNLGTTSGEAIIQAVNFYNAMTMDDRALMSRMFSDIYKNFDNEILSKNENWNIRPLEMLQPKPQNDEPPQI